MKEKNPLYRLVQEISTSREKIIDDFIKTYVASRLEWFKEKPERLTRLQLVEVISDDQLTRTYTVEIKTGKPKKL